MKILIADDSPLIRDRLGRFLLEQKYEVIIAENGRDAIAIYKKQLPDIVFMDILMPDIDGISAMIQILNEFPLARIIILSSVGQQSKIIEAIQKGASDFLVKPFEPIKIISAIEKLTSI